MAPVNKKAAGQKKKKRGPRRIKLKGWLSTPEAWAAFNTWAKVNALPRKLPGPEPVDRGPQKPLSYFKKRLKKLAVNNKKHQNQQCGTKEVSRAALKARASLRLMQLACPKLRCCVEECQQWTIRPSALVYKASRNIKRLARPKASLEEGCRSQVCISRAAINRYPTVKDCWLAIPKTYRSCEDSDPDEEQNESRPYNKEWCDFLAIPSYRVLKYLETDQGKEWVENYEQALEARTKQAMQEYTEKQREAEKEKRRELRKKRKEAKKRRQKELKEKLRQQQWEELEEWDEENMDEEKYENDDDQKVEKDDDESDEEDSEDDEAEKVEEQKEETEEEIAARKKRKIEKNRWRKQIQKCKPFPPEISEEAKNYQASGNISKMAEPKKYRSGCRKDPYKVKEEALNYSATPAIETLAKPKYPHEPVERYPLPREKDEYGSPIFPKTEYGKKPRTARPFKSKRECPKKEEEDDKEDDKEEDKEEGQNNDIKNQNKIAKTDEKKLVIDRIAYEVTIDPLFDRKGAEKQLKARKKLMKKKRKKAQKRAENETQTEAGSIKTATELVDSTVVDAASDESAVSEAEKE